jgi:hypothetical protein
MSIINVHPATILQEPGSAMRIVRRAAVAIQLALLVLLVVGRAFGAIGDAHLSHSGSLVTPLHVLSSQG